MVLGVRNQNPPQLELNYVVHIVDVKPWAPSQSLRTLRSVVIHWEHSDGSCGFTNQAVPGGDGRIEFNESFVVREDEETKKTKKNKCIEFNLYEPRWDKGLKGQLLASVVLDLAAYDGFAVKGEDLSITTPIYCKRTYKNAAQPLLFLKIIPASSLRESVSALMTEEYAEEASLATDMDHASSHSSPTATSPFFNTKNEERAGASSSSMDLSSDIEWISGRIKSQSLQSYAVKEACKRQGSSCKISEHQKEENMIVATGKTDAKTRLSCEEEGRTNYPPLNGTREVLNIDHQVDMQKGMALEDGVTNGGGSTRRNHHVTGSISSERKAFRTETRNLGRIHQLENRIKILEGELMEAAALEVSLYSVVAEHGSSMNKVHAPARRLSRLYF